MNQEMTISELAEQADVTPRTVRYYIQNGVLPAPGTAGPGAHYDRGYLHRLRLIKRLQKAHLPLAEIRERLGALDDDAVRELLSEPVEPAAQSAAEYVRAVLREDPATMALSPAPSMVRESAPAPYPTSQRSQWDRIPIDPDVELHVRRPLSREKNRALHDLLDQARTLFGKMEEP